MKWSSNSFNSFNKVSHLFILHFIYRIEKYHQPPPHNTTNYQIILMEWSFQNVSFVNGSHSASFRSFIHSFHIISNKIWIFFSISVSINKMNEQKYYYILFISINSIKKIQSFRVAASFTRPRDISSMIVEYRREIS